MYVNNTDYINDTDITIGLSSGGKDDTSEIKLKKPVEQLKDGWNEINIDFANADTTLSQAEGYNATSVNYIRIYTNKLSDENLVTIIDDIRGLNSEDMPAEQADMRFVTTVDSKYYKSVGFIIKVANGTPKTREATSVYKQIYAVGSNKLLTYNPYVFAVQSKYFSTHTINNIPSASYGTYIYVTPYWVTQDGTTVKGTQKTYSVNYLAGLNQ